jgi:hypothetical protein
LSIENYFRCKVSGRNTSWFTRKHPRYLLPLLANDSSVRDMSLPVV